jgi:hypothetical protein
MVVSDRLHPPAALPPERELPPPTQLEVGWASKPVGTLWKTQNLLLLPGASYGNTHCGCDTKLRILFFRILFDFRRYCLSIKKQRKCKWQQDLFTIKNTNYECDVSLNDPTEGASVLPNQYSSPPERLTLLSSKTHTAQNLSSSRLLSINIKLKYEELQFSHVVWMSVKLVLSREEQRLRVFESRVLRKIFGP